MGFSSVCTLTMNTQEPALDSPFVSESWIGIMGGSPSNRNPDEDQSSALSSPSDETSTGIPGHVLIIEDNEADVFLIEEAINTAKLPVVLEVLRDGEQAVRFFDRADADATSRCPALVILDINLPRMQGGDVLKHLRQSRKCANAVVVAVSTSDSARDREQMMNLGANGYFRKPSAYDDFMKLGDMIKALLGRTDTST